MDERLVYYNLERPDRVMRKIRDVLLEDARVLVAVAFGSILTRRRVRDIDIAVYSGEKLELRELLLLGLKIEEKVGIPIDLSPLEDMPPCMRYRVMAKGLRLAVRSERLFSELLAAAFSECEDARMLWKMKA